MSLLLAGAAAPLAVQAADLQPQLVGTLVWPTGKRAIFATGDAPDTVLEEGDRLGAFMVTHIAPGKVTIERPEGTVVLNVEVRQAPSRTAPRAVMPARPASLPVGQAGRPAPPADPVDEN